MNYENTMKLFNDFPKLYRGKDKSIKESLMPLGFQCGDGWFNLIYELSAKIDEICKRDNVDVEVIEVKEKYGELCFYYFGGNDEIAKLVDEYERKSADICEICGKPGKVIEINGWFACRCEVCKNKF